MAERKSLSPVVDELKTLIKPNNPDDTQKVQDLFQKARVYETKINLHNQYEDLENQLIKEIGNTQYYKNAKETIENLKGEFSSYTVDIDFDENDKLQENFSIDIRHSGTQHRHITPVAIINRIVNNHLNSAITTKEENIHHPTLICKGLLFSIELFINLNKDLLQQEEQEYIQKIIDFFKNEKNYNPRSVKLLIKILAHFYNQILLVTTDNYISTYSTNDFYLIPTFKFAPKATILCHRKEGSFITAQLKILDGFNKRTQASELQSKEIQQVIYTVFAIFDFLPLPKIQKSFKTKNKTCNTNRDRYKDEPVERLQQVAANHLLFALEAYPNLWLRYKDEIIEGFLKYVSYGIDINTLVGIIDGVSNVKELAAELNMTQTDVKRMFTNEGKNASVCGFAQQYQNKNLKITSKKFFDDFYSKVVSYMEIKDISYLENSPMRKAIKARLEYEEDILCQKIENAGVDIVFNCFQKNESYSELCEGASLLEKSLNINSSNFLKIFQGKFLEFANKEMSIPSKYKEFEKKFDTIKGELGERQFQIILQKAISYAYTRAFKSSILDKSSPEKEKILKQLGSESKLQQSNQHATPDRNYNPGEKTPEYPNKIMFSVEDFSSPASPLSPYNPSISILSPSNSPNPKSDYDSDSQKKTPESPNPSKHRSTTPHSDKTASEKTFQKTKVSWDSGRLFSNLSPQRPPDTSLSTSKNSGQKSESNVQKRKQFFENLKHSPPSSTDNILKVTATPEVKTVPAFPSTPTSLGNEMDVSFSISGEEASPETETKKNHGSGNSP